MFVIITVQLCDLIVKQMQFQKYKTSEKLEGLNDFSFLKIIQWNDV